MSNPIKKKILVADDDPGILEALTYMLEDEGYEVRTSVDGNVIPIMKDDQPDLLLLDLWMSGQNGSDICRELKSNTNTSHIPVIIISANRDTKAIAFACGADDFLTKPFEMEDLLKMVKKYTRNSLLGQRK